MAPCDRPSRSTRFGFAPRNAVTFPDSPGSSVSRTLATTGVLRTGFWDLRPDRRHIRKLAEKTTVRQNRSRLVAKGRVIRPADRLIDCLLARSPFCRSRRSAVSACTPDNARCFGLRHGQEEIGSGPIHHRQGGTIARTFAADHAVTAWGFSRL
jgi:hypothetical protein